MDTSSEPVPEICSLLFWGYIAGAAVMIAGGLVEAVLGVSAEGKSLEDIARPIACRD
jgi:hypothetical protein